MKKMTRFISRSLQGEQFDPKEIMTFLPCLAVVCLLLTLWCDYMK